MVGTMDILIFVLFICSFGLSRRFRSKGTGASVIWKEAETPGTVPLGEEKAPSSYQRGGRCRHGRSKLFSMVPKKQWLYSEIHEIQLKHKNILGYCDCQTLKFVAEGSSKVSILRVSFKIQLDTYLGNLV